MEPASSLSGNDEVVEVDNRTLPLISPRRALSTPSSRRSSPFAPSRCSFTWDALNPPPLLPPRRTSYTTSTAVNEFCWSDGIQPMKTSGSEQADCRLLARSHSVRSVHRLRVATSSVQLSGGSTPSRTSSLRDQSAISVRSSLETLHESGGLATLSTASNESSDRISSGPLVARRSQTLKRSALRHESMVSEGHATSLNSPEGTIDRVSSESSLYSESGTDPRNSHPPHMSDPWQLPSLISATPMSHIQDSPSPASTINPRFSFTRVSSFHQAMEWRDERLAHKRASSIFAQQQNEPDDQDEVPAVPSTRVPSLISVHKMPGQLSDAPRDDTAERSLLRGSKFRHIAAETGFIITIAMTQLLCEYLVSGFAVVLPKLLSRQHIIGVGSTGVFWPAALLTLILSATLLVFARISDMYGGYGPFMFGLGWLVIWTLIPGFHPQGILLDVSRAMQGLALAAFTPSTFTMVGSYYAEGPRRNVVLGVYGACAPLGFFAGFLAGGALPVTHAHWYFWIASGLAFLTALLAYFSVPIDRTNRKQLGLSMDWLGAGLITGGLILVTYALSVEPYVNQFDQTRNGFTFPMVWAPLASGSICLLAAVWVEGWYASCPLLPFEFFRPRGIVALSISCLFLFASFGVWLYNSAEYFNSDAVTGVPGGISGLTLSLWYTPLAVLGIVLCVVGGSVSHVVPLRILLIISGFAWVAAPLIFAVSPLPLNYWKAVLPSMVCATLGIDLTYTATTIIMSSSQPLKYQGIAGAVTSILVNLAMSFSLPISLIVEEYTSASMPSGTDVQATAATLRGYRAAFYYGAASAGVGLLVTIFFVHVSRKVVSARRVDSEVEERPRATSSEASTLAHEVVQLRDLESQQA